MSRLADALREMESAPSANPANPANLTPSPAQDSQHSQDSQQGGVEIESLADALESLSAAQVGRERMDKGLPPLEWGEPVARSCEGCGPVLLWAGCPDVVKACPWCFRRKAGKAIARPTANDSGVTP
jgi:hypothetical protein